MIRYFMVDAFTDTLFRGNPAGVCWLTKELSTELMQCIAAEHNLPETAFILPQGEEYVLRWFTPEYEIDLCGHATLASAFVIMNFFAPGDKLVRFQTLSGFLTVRHLENDLYELDFPARKAAGIPVTPLMEAALGVAVKEAHLATALMLLVETEAQVQVLQPDFSLLRQIQEAQKIIVTAPGEAVDFVSRYLTPHANILEDPVTGSAHTTLIPFWSSRLQKDQMVARQLSKRGGTLYCENCGERVKFAGQARLYLQGEIQI